MLIYWIGMCCSILTVQTIHGSKLVLGLSHSTCSAFNFEQSFERSILVDTQLLAVLSLNYCYTFTFVLEDIFGFRTVISD